MKQEMSGPGARRAPRFADAAVRVEQLPGGGMILRSPQPLQPYARCVGEWLERWARQAPGRTFLAERDGTGGWRKLNYGEAQAAARAIGQALLDRGLGARRPVMILSDNGIDHALLALGAMQAGVPVAPVSTGQPKGVVNTQRMLCSNQQSYAQAWPFLEDRPPVILDWLPWNHTFGGNSDFNLILRNGGTLFIDEGRPAPGLIERSVANLREVSPTLYLNVPRGFALILDHLERDGALARNFFRELDLIFYAGAALPQSLWQRIEALSQKTIGRTLTMLSAWGTTETAPMATIVHYPIARAGNIGLPAPGCEIKLVPHDDKLEIRVRGANVSPGYWQRPDLTAEAFDADGFYRPGDAARLADPADPARGIVFDGRIGENFKLGSGTWVSTGALRIAVIAAGAPVIEDAVIAGHDRDEIALLIFPSLAGCRGLCSHMPVDAPLKMLIAESAVREALSAGLARHNAQAGGSSHRIARALLLDRPASIDQGEITDKGYLNQRAVLANRAALVERLYADPPDAEVIRLR